MSKRANIKKKIKYVTIACNIANGIFVKLVKELKKNKFKTELDIYNYLKKQAYSKGCRLSYKPVVGTGGNASVIHHKADDTKLGKGFLIIDFGVKYNGYCSDCTRTFYLGKPSKKDVYFYNLILESQLTALNHVRIGVSGADLDLISRAALWKYFKNYAHAAGHGIGRKVHQYPRISPNSNSIMKPGQIITIEPGLYFKDKFGIRIEDTILVDENPKILTKFTKKLIVI